MKLMVILRIFATELVDEIDFRPNIVTDTFPFRPISTKGDTAKMPHIVYETSGLSFVTVSSEIIALWFFSEKDPKNEEWNAAIDILINWAKTTPVDCKILIYSLGGVPSPQQRAYSKKMVEVADARERATGAKTPVGLVAGDSSAITTMLFNTIIGVRNRLKRFGTLEDCLKWLDLPATSEDDIKHELDELSRSVNGRAPQVI